MTESGLEVYSGSFATDENFTDSNATTARIANGIAGTGDTTGDGQLDLMYGRPLGMTSLTALPDLTLVRWFGRSSLKTSFSSFTVWAENAGDEGDYFL